VFVRNLPDGGRLRARIVETEAYEPEDPASHAFRGPTPRNRTMFGAPGRLYVYFTYGMHFCMNVVTGAVGRGSAVLLRAAEPLEGVEEMARRRDGRRRVELCSGPARWCRAFGIDRTLDGEDLVGGGVVWIDRGTPPQDTASGRRVGVRAGRELEWRFYVPEDPYVSKAEPASGRAVTPSRPCWSRC
jgi:DNA-3-methyladenine glycosylase